MNDLLLGVGLWVLGGWIGAQIAAFFNRGNRLGFWGRVAAGVIGGVILGGLVDRAPFLKPITDFLHSGHIEDAIAGAIGGFVFGMIGALFSKRGKNQKVEGSPASSAGDSDAAVPPRRALGKSIRIARYKRDERPFQPERSAMAPFILAVFVVALIIVFSALKFVPQGYNYTVVRFGKYTRTLQPGLSVIVPIVDAIGKKMNMMETVVDVPNQEVITKDNAMVSTDAVVFIQVIDAAKAAYQVTNLSNAITNLSLTNVRTVVGSMDLDEVLSRRDDINERLLKVIDAATNPWGVKVTRIEIKDLTPPHDITEAMAKQMKAEREKRAEILSAEGQKQSQILRAEGLKEAAIREAEGRRQAAFLDAEARERSAEAEAKATTMVSDAIATGDKAAINYFLGQQYVAAFGKLAESDQQRTLILPAELSSLAATLGGISEIAKSAVGPRDHGEDGGPAPEGGTPWTR